MMGEVYLFFAIGGFWSTLVLSVIFLFSINPKNEKLHNYRVSKYIMAFAYLLFAAISLLEIIPRWQGLNPPTFKASTLVIFSCQLFLFTHANISLIDCRFLSVKKLTFHMMPVAMLGLLTFLSYYLHWGPTALKVCYYSLFIVYFISVVISWYIFQNHYKRYKKRFHNYFIENRVDRLRWVYNSHLFLLFGSLAVIAFSLISVRIIVIFPVIIILFYTLYAIHFLDYRNIFFVMEPILEEEPLKQIKTSPVTLSHIEKSLTEWENKKSFMHPKLTIAIVAKQISTNRTYLSQYINTTREKTFNEWINELRIEEAKRMIEQDSSMTLEEISEIVGYADKGYFSKCFVKYTGKTVSQWKKR